MEWIFPSIVIVVVTFGVLSLIYRRRKFDKLSAVNPDVEYPNNHHVMGVGYYHAAAQRWCPNPWNEYREGRGYYWNGTWNPTPDQSMVPKSMPEASEVERVNREWRRADPDRTRQFWDTVEHEGFGTAIRRSEGS
jgi:hypothetical protein